MCDTEVAHPLVATQERATCRGQVRILLGRELRSLSVQSIDDARARLDAASGSIGTAKPATRGPGAVKPGLRKGSGAPKAPRALARAISKELAEAVEAVHAENQRFGPFFQSTREADIGVVTPAPDEPIILVTDTVVIEGAKKS